MLILPSLKTVLSVVVIVSAFAISQEKLKRVARKSDAGAYFVAALGIIGMIAIYLA